MHDIAAATSESTLRRLRPLGEFITLAHGNGGRLTRELIDAIFAHHFGAGLDTTVDAAPLAVPNGELVMTTDGFIVEPLVFPGGSIGSLAVNGTVNDLAVAGALPLHLTINAFIEEGLSMATLDRLIADVAEAARANGAMIAAGDTKVLRRGEGSGLYLGMAGVGVRQPGVQLTPRGIRPGDKLLVSGPIGDHGAAVLLARTEYGLSGDLKSDCASILPIAKSLLNVAGLRFMRDPTRGGIATVAHEIVRATGFGVRLIETEIPVRSPVSAVCELLGFDPLMLACEGRMLAVVAPDSADDALAVMREVGCPEAAIIGAIDREPMVVLTTALGERVVDELENDPLPRIC